MVLLTEAFMALTERMVVLLFWTSCTHFSALQCFLHQPVHRQGITVRPLTVFHTLIIQEENHNVEQVSPLMRVKKECFLWQMVVVWYGLVILEV
jgi:hypothetical protein